MMVVCRQTNRFLLLSALLVGGCTPSADPPDHSPTEAVSFAEDATVSPEAPTLLDDSPVAQTNSVHRGERVSIQAALHEADPSGDTATLTLDFKVDADWHIYAMDASSGANQPTVIDVHLPPNVVFVSDWSLPQPEIQFSDLGMQSMYTGQFQMTRSVAISSSQDKNEITLEVFYQSCSRQQCLPPTKATLVIPIPKKQRR